MKLSKLGKVASRKLLGAKGNSNPKRSLAVAWSFHESAFTPQGTRRHLSPHDHYPPCVNSFYAEVVHRTGGSQPERRWLTSGDTSSIRGGFIDAPLWSTSH